jgi:hypothetical protein
LRAVRRRRRPCRAQVWSPRCLAPPPPHLQYELRSGLFKGFSGLIGDALEKLPTEAHTGALRRLT